MTSMQRLSRRSSSVAASGSALIALVAAGCASAPLDPMAPAPIEVPAYVQVPHPIGEDIGDIEGIFRDPRAPGPDEIAICDTKFRKLAAATRSREEILAGARELVRIEPVLQHWCFYGKMLELEGILRDPAGLIESRQRAVTDAYLYLTPVAKAFLTEYRDSRYWRIGLSRYRRLSELVFFRKVEPTPQTTSELVVASNPFAWMRPGDFSTLSVLRKYGVIDDSAAGTGAAAAPSVPPTAGDSAIPATSGESPSASSVEGTTYPAQESEIPEIPEVSGSGPGSSEGTPAQP
jgi:hypothetical protein